MLEIALYPVTTAATSFNSAPLLLNDNDGVYIQVLFSGSDVVGTLTLQASADNTTYITIAGSSQAVTASSNSAWNVSDLNAKYIRAVWAYTSGTGNISVKANIKSKAVTAVAR